MHHQRAFGVDQQGVALVAADPLAERLDVGDAALGQGRLEVAGGIRTEGARTQVEGHIAVRWSTAPSLGGMARTMASTENDARRFPSMSYTWHSDRVMPAPAKVDTWR